MGSGTAQSRVTSFFFQEICRIPPALLYNISTTCFLLQSDFSALFFRRHFAFLIVHIKDDFGAKRGDLNLNILLLSAKKGKQNVISLPIVSVNTFYCLFCPFIPFLFAIDVFVNNMKFSSY